MSPIAEAAVHRDAAICPQLENKPKLPLGRADRPPEFIAAARFCCRLVSTSDLSFLVCSIAAERLCAPAHIKCGSANSTWEEIMGHLILQGDNTIYNGFALLGESSLAMTLIDTGTGGFGLDFLVLSGTTSVSIGSAGPPAALIRLFQLAETTNDLTAVSISGAEKFSLGSDTGHSNSDDGVVTDIAATATSPTRLR